MPSGSAKTLTFLVFLLVAFGLVMLSSAGVVEGQKRFGSPYYFFKHQLVYGVLPGLLLFWAISKINYRSWRKFALPILILAVGLVILVFVPRFGLSIKGAQRWIHWRSVTIQPAEFLKLAVIIYLAAWFSRRGAQSSNWPYSLAPFLVILGFIGLLLVLQPDVKTLALVSAIGLAMYFFAGARLRHIFLIFLIFALILGAISFFEPYRFNRIKAYLNPSIDKQGLSYHINQALLGVGSGGIFGLGFGQSRQKANYLPEPVGDSIFAVIVEELGFVGGTGLIALYVLLVLTLTQIARQTYDQFGKLLVLGLAVWVVAQAFVNIGAVLNLIPLTGAPLPFISFGSSSLVALLSGMGVAASVARRS